MGEVVSAKAIMIATGRRTLTGATDADGEPVTQPETRTLPPGVPFDPSLLTGEADALLADGTIVLTGSPEGRRIVASVRE